MGLTCQDLVEFILSTGQTCEVELENFDTSYENTGILVKDVCQASCDACYDGNISEAQIWTKKKKRQEGKVYTGSWVKHLIEALSQNVKIFDI